MNFKFIASSFHNEARQFFITLNRPSQRKWKECLIASITTRFALHTDQPGHPFG